MGLFNAVKYDLWYESKLGKQVLESELSVIEQIILSMYGVPKKGCKVIDVGCGTGRFGSYFKKYGCDVFCVDIDEDMLKIAKRRGLKVVSADAQTLPFPDSYFDLAISVTLLEFVPDYVSVIKEMVRVVKHAGLVIFGVLNKWSIWAIHRMIKSKFWRNVRFFTPIQVSVITQGPVFGAVIFPPFYTPVNTLLDLFLKRTPFRYLGAIIFGFIVKK